LAIRLTSAIISGLRQIPAFLLFSGYLGRHRIKQLEPVAAEYCLYMPDQS
jgi:hypothetical protein